jgi:biopolymer transport protein TolQ
MTMASAYLFLAEAAQAGGHGAETDIISLIGRASLVAKLVLLILLIMGIVAIALIISKSLQFRRAQDQNRQFLNVFWNEKSVEEAFSKSDRFVKSPIAAVFKSGAREIKKIASAKGDSSWQVDEHGLANVGRALMRSSNTEVASLEKYLGLLAIMASAGPFIGLFGTVWGIMVSFQDIASQGQATLATVAPGIAEALVATAAGLFVAIPAVVAYNSFAGRVKRQSIDMDGFSQDFINIVQRGTHGD